MVVPATRGPLVAAFILAAVLTIRSYVAPLVFGRQQDWTLAILIARMVLSGQDMPGAVAPATLLPATTPGLVLLAARFSRACLDRP